MFVIKSYTNTVLFTSVVASWIPDRGHPSSQALSLGLKSSAIGARFRPQREGLNRCTSASDLSLDFVIPASQGRSSTESSFI